MSGFKIVALTLTPLGVLLNIRASRAVFRSDIAPGVQTGAWLLLIWLIPLLGAILALQVSKEPQVINGASVPSESGSETMVPGVSGSDISSRDGSPHGAASFHHGP